MATQITIARGAGGYGFNLSRVGGYHVFRHVDEAGPAFQAGARVGDSIVAVNGVDTKTIAHKEVATLISTSPGGVVKLAIAPLPMEVLQQAASASGIAPPAAAGPAPQEPADGRFLINIDKVPGGMGFNLAKVGDYHVFRVVDPGSPAQRAGAREGLCILSVNDLNTVTMAHKDVVDVIRKAVDRVTMVVMPLPAEALTVAAARRASQAEDEVAQVAQERVKVEQSAVNLEHLKLSKEQEALKAEQKRVEAERAKLIAEQESLRQQQERLKQERRTIDRSQGLVEEAWAAAANAQAEKLAAEEKVRQLLEEERQLREYQTEVERLRAELAATTGRVSAAKKKSEQTETELSKAATPKDLKDIATMVGLVEQKAREDLTARQGRLPSDEKERILEEKRREIELLCLAEQVEGIRQGEFEKLQQTISTRKAEADRKQDEMREKMRDAHFKDQQLLKERQSRLQSIMSDAVEQKRKADEEAAAQRKAEMEAKRRESQEKIEKMRKDMLEAEERKRAQQAEEMLRQKREQEAREALRLREAEEARLATQRASTQALLDSKQRQIAPVTLATAPPPAEKKLHPMVQQMGKLNMAQSGGLLRFEKSAPNTQL